MSFFDSILVSIFSMALVFLVLASLYALIQIFAKLVGIFKHEAALPVNVPAEQAEVLDEGAKGPEVSAGELRLKGVDEKTAAMIMAIISHESGIPLSELQFKSIKAIEQS
ncbi:MAG TPA: OadG family protein [Clostridiales bacterium]|nr:OadG family protein [Clostridiales bacterium]